MANDYYALMQALQQPRLQRQQQNRQGISDLMNTVFQGVMKQKIKKDIEAKISQAEKEGKEVEYKVDPQTGLITPVIKSESYKNIFEALKNPEVAKNYELGVGAGGKPRLIKKKQISATKLAGMKKIAESPDDLFKVRNPIGGEDTDFDINKDEDISRALEMAGILEDASDWRNNPELIEAGLPAMIDKRRKAKEKKEEPTKKGVIQKITEFMTQQPKTKGPLAQKSAGAFKAGDIRKNPKDGKDYIRDAAGKWHPVSE